MMRSATVAVAAAAPMIATVASPGDATALTMAALIAGLAVLGTRRPAYAHAAVLSTAAALATSGTTIAAALAGGIGAAVYSVACLHFPLSLLWASRVVGWAVACGVVAAACAAGPRLPGLALLAPAAVLATVATTLRMARPGAADTDQRHVSGADHAVSERPLSKPGG
ncbi:hypothetical protein GV791_06210 [Nocardia cyriacigeorgica]|uniref:Uncharacterized protein n=1 Tax=Nocardia cyriacigeorgica TaxID=135487 RepID=A0A6P1CLE7_9NOCA|nr:hypothetical protein [Nocardia cyriacigeorgica]NEW32154.1 hypothetical protein [Nocardia cyriacigeorgica]